MKVLVFTGNRNRPGKRDFTGTFQPEADSFAKLQGGTVVRVPLEGNEQTRRAFVLGQIKIHQPDWIAFVCHGLTTGIELGFRRVHVVDLARRLADVGCARVTLYACSTGGGPGLGGDRGFADMLRDAMCRAGLVDCRVDAHVGPGHATRRPYVRRFEGHGERTGGAGGVYLVEEGSELWPLWKRALRTDKADRVFKASTLRFRFPAMTVEEIRAELLGELLKGKG